MPPSRFLRLIGSWRPSWFGWPNPPFWWSTKPTWWTRPRRGAEKFAEYLAKELKAFNFAPIVFAAAAKSEGVGELSQLVLDLYDQARERMATGPLNAAFEAILKERGPSSALGTRAKIYFVSQTSVAPPTIVCKVNKPSCLKGATAVTSKTDCVSWCHSRRCHLWSTLSPDHAKVCMNSEPLVAAPNTMPPKNWTSSCRRARLGGRVATR